MESQIIEDEPHLFFAEQADRGHTVLISTYVSPLVDVMDPLWFTIRRTLAESCYVVSEPRIVRDVDMMFGCAQSTEFEVFKECPGNIDHQCLNERSKQSVA